MLNSSVFIFLMLRALYRMICKNAKLFLGKNSINVSNVKLFLIFKASKLQSSPSSDYFFCLLRIFAFVTDLCLHLVLFCSHKPFS